ncbi:MAG: acyl-CoA thioesterase [Flammeovirgaceae bacterium]|nr:acyl-CoA thioesterase [Flammeovirgaceae bacterium]
MAETGKKVAYSQTIITELMIPSYANFGGKIHGGILLSLMDKVAYVCASKHAGNYCVTVSVDNVEFLQPVEVGDVVSMHASVNFVGKTSLVVGIKVIAENVKKGLVKHTNSSYFTMVAKDEDKPTVVPPLILESTKEVRRFWEAMQRRELKRNFNEKMDKTKNIEDLQKALETIKSQRCIVRFE